MVRGLGSKPAVHYEGEDAIIAVQKFFSHESNLTAIDCTINGCDFLLIHDARTRAQYPDMHVYTNDYVIDIPAVHGVAVRRIPYTDDYLAFQCGDFELSIPLGMGLSGYLDSNVIRDIEDQDESKRIVLTDEEFNSLFQCFCSDEDGNDVLPLESLTFLEVEDEYDSNIYYGYKFGNGWELSIRSSDRNMVLWGPTFDESAEVEYMNDEGVPMGGISFYLESGWVIFFRHYLRGSDCRGVA